MHLSVLFDPTRWSITVPGLPGGAAPVRNPSHTAWSRQNSHTHPISEILFCLNGHTFMGAAGDVYPCSPGSVFFFPPFCAHDNNYPPDTPDLEHLWVSFLAGTVIINSHRYSNGHATATGHWQLPLAGTGLPDLTGPYNEIWEGFDAAEPGLKMFRFRTTAVRAAELVVDTITGSSPLPGKDERHRMTVTNICAHLERTGGAGATLDTLARVSGYSKYHFHRMFTEYAGMTLHAYVEQCRIRKTRQLLREGKTKSETGYALGFSCPAAFSRWFKNRF